MFQDYLIAETAELLLWILVTVSMLEMQAMPLPSTPMSCAWELVTKFSGMKFTREDELLFVSFLNLDIGFRSYALSNIKGPIDCWLFITKVLIVFDHPSLPIPENVIANSTSHPSSRSSAVGNCRVPNLFFIFITFLQVKVNNIFLSNKRKKLLQNYIATKGLYKERNFKIFIIAVYTMEQL